MPVLTSPVLGFATLNALSGFVVVQLCPMPMGPYLDVTIRDASSDAGSLLACPSLFRSM